MAALTDAMKWYDLKGSKPTAPRLKYHFQVQFFASQYQQEFGDLIRDIFKTVRTVELPKVNLETETLNAWNLRVPITTKIRFEPVSITFNDTLDNKFQTFIAKYMNIISGSFNPTMAGIRTGLDTFGLKSLEKDKYTVLDKIEITKFYGPDNDRVNFDNWSKVTLWRPIIVDVINDTLDYSASEALTWTTTFRYESVTYDTGADQSTGDIYT